MIRPSPRVTLMLLVGDLKPGINPSRLEMKTKRKRRAKSGRNLGPFLPIYSSDRLIIHSMYGIGTGLPVMIFAIVVAFSMHKLGEIYNNMVTFETWFRKITGWIFIIAGIYFTVMHYI